MAKTYPRIRSWLSPLLLALACSTEASKAEESPQQRIITLSPHLAEIVAELGAVNQLVGVSDSSNFPSSVKNIKVVSDFQNINFELIKQLNPDLIFIWKSGISAKQQATLQSLFKNSNTQLIQSDATSLSEIGNEFQRLGKIIGKEKVGQELAKKFKQDLFKLESNNQYKSSVSVFYQAWPSPVMTINGKHLISDMIRVCGGKQIFADQKILVPTVSIEAVIERNPEVVITSSENVSNTTTQDNLIWKKYPELKVNQLNGYLSVNGDLMTRPTSRALLATQQICTFLDQVRENRRKTKQ
jgi:iron complex transport system substrate-binding protein